MTDESSKVERTRLALWALAEAEARVAAPEHVEAEVMRAWDAIQADRSRPAATYVVGAAKEHAARVLFRWALVPAVAFGMVWAVVRGVERRPSIAVQPSEVATLPAAGTAPKTSGLVEERPPSAAQHETLAGMSGPNDVHQPATLAPARRWQPGTVAQESRGPSAVVFVGEQVGEGEHVRVVRMQVPRATLASLGVSAAEGSETVYVDLFVGEDGVARALRVEM